MKTDESTVGGVISETKIFGTGSYLVLFYLPNMTQQGKLKGKEDGCTSRELG
jgi:hypothetical protein